MAHYSSAWRTAVKQEPQKAKRKKQPMSKSNDNAAMNVRSRLQVEQISSQSSHADKAERNWRLVLANYPIKELVREKIERFVMLMLYRHTRNREDR